MCQDKCNKCNQCNPCDNNCRKQECGCKFEVDTACIRYTKKDLECLNLPKGTLLEDIIEAIDKKICQDVETDSCNGLYLSLNPMESENYIKVPEIVLTGGTAPYTYKWSLQQTGGTSYTIGDTTTSDYSTMLTSMQGTYGDCTGVMGGVPCRASYMNGVTDPTHVWHFKLEVTDANGCKVKDYWTQYQVYTF